MVTFASPVQQAVKHVLKLDGQRYFLASDQAAGDHQVQRAWDVVRVPRQEGDPRREFEIALDTFNLGYGYSFASSPGVYERARGWDLSAPGKARTWPRLTTCEEVESTDYRGWLYYDQPSGYLYMFRGSYSTKYQPDDSSAEWQIVEYHYFGDDIVVSGKPATYNGKTYVPLINTSTGSLSNMQELDTISDTTTEVQDITESGTPTGGTFTISYNDGVTTSTTAALDFDATASEVQAALREFPGFQKVTVSRTGTTSDFVWTVTMTAVPAATGSTSPAALTTTDSLTGGTTPETNVTVDTAGVGDQWDTSDIALRYFTVWNKPTVGPLLVGATANQIRTCATTPTTGSNWSTAQDVCDSTFNVTSLATWGRFLMCGTPNMLYSFDEQGTAVEELEEFKYIADDDNFVGMVAYGGYLLCPHKAGLIRWRPGYKKIVGAEQDGYLDGERDSGFGRSIGLAPYGENCYQTISDIYNSIGLVAALEAKDGPRGPLTPHMHFEYQAAVEDCAVIGLKANGAPATGVQNASDNNAVGTIAWSDPENVEVDDSNAATASGTGTTHYLECLLNAGSRVPVGATVTGVKVDIRRGGGATPQFVSAKSAAASGSTMTIDKPTGVQTGDLLLFWAVQGNTGSFGIPTGFTALDNQAGGSSTRARTAYRVVDGSEGSSFSITGFDSAATGGIAAYRGVQTPSDDSLSISSTFDDSISAQAVTAPSDDTLIVGLYSTDTTWNTWTAPPGMTKRYGSNAVLVCDYTVTTSGSTGGKRATYDGTGEDRCGALIALQPSAGSSTDATVRLVVGGAVTGDNKADTVSKWPSTATVKSYGGSNDMWGASITEAQANASDFGFVLSTTLASDTEARVFYATITVYYTVAGGGDPAAFLGVITLSEDRATATPYIYKLPRYGLPAANDPNIGKAIADADFYTSRYVNPSRNVQKVYRSVEFYVDLDPEESTPGFQVWASVEDGTEFQLRDSDGDPATILTSGAYELYFPTTSASVGRWVQIKPVVPALGGAQVPVSVDLRDVTIHASWTPKMTDEVTAVIYCGQGVHEDGFKETRSGEKQLADLIALFGPRESGDGPITLTDPETGEETHCVISGEASKRIRYQQVSPGTFVATVVLRKAVYQ